MEIQTTIKDLPEKIKQLGVSPETFIRVIIFDDKQSAPRKKSHFPFLHSDVWSDKEGETDISENIDRYLYDMEDIHGE